MPLERPVICPILIGRVPYLEAIACLVEQENDGQRTMLIAGEAGIGKSRLVAEAKALAARRDLLVLEGRCFETDRSLPFGPLLDLLRTYISTFPLEEVWAGLEPTAGHFARLLPDLAALFPGLVPAPEIDPEQEKRRIFEAVTEFIARLAGARPVLVIIEDLHWSDDTSLELFLHLARRTAHRPVSLVFTYRSDEVHPGLAHFLAQLDRERLALELHLARFDRDEVAAMLRAIFSLQRPVQGEFLEAIFSLTDGNPFFIEEVLKSLILSGDIYYADGAWERKPVSELHIPRSVQDSVERRVAQLDVPARQTLALAAVAGRRFDFSLLQRLVDCDDRELLARIKAYTATQLVVEESAEQFAFRHALTRQSIYASLLTRERQAMHLQIARMLEQMHASSLDTHLDELAYHYYEGAAWMHALDYSRRAGQKAWALYSPQAAVEHLTRALDAAANLGGGPLPDLHRMRGLAYETLGDFDRAWADQLAALDAARVRHDTYEEWQALVNLGFLWAGRDYSRAGDFYKQAIALARELEDPAPLADSLNWLANWLVNTGQAAEGLEVHRQALDIFKAQGDRHGYAKTLDLMGMASGISGDILLAVQFYREAIALLRELHDTRALSSSLAGLSVYESGALAETVYSTPGTPAECRKLMDEALRLALQAGSPADQSFAHFVGAQALASFGELGEALDHARKAMEIAAEIDHRQWVVAAGFCLGYVHFQTLAADRAIEVLRDALTRAQQVGSAWWIGNTSAYLALAYLLKDDARAAREVVDAALPPEAKPRNSSERRVTLARGRLMLAQGNPETALRLVEELIDTVPGEHPRRPMPHLLMLKGEALLALRRPLEAVDALQVAKAAAVEGAALPALWQLHRALGRAYQRAARSEDAQREFAQARTVVESLASRIDPEDLRDSFRRQALGSLPREQPPSARRVQADRFDGLTEREREVAALIARGWSNQEIADQLVLSKRTIEVHVGNILAKLEATTRGQVAVWAIRKGLAEG